jgi:hypothetical protein
MSGSYHERDPFVHGNNVSSSSPLGGSRLSSWLRWKPLGEEPIRQVPRVAALNNAPSVGGPLREGLLEGGIQDVNEHQGPRRLLMLAGTTSQRVAKVDCTPKCISDQ